MDGSRASDQHHAERAASGVARHHQSNAKATAAALMGFVSGIAFWHLVGFWGFVHEAVFHGTPADSAQLAAARTALLKTQGRHSGQAGPLLVAAESCSEVTIGPDGVSRVAGCAPSAFKYFPGRGMDRADFADFGSPPESTLINTSDPIPAAAAPAVGGWAAEIAPANVKP